MKNRIVVLGAGLVGSAIAMDLSKNHAVTSVDYSLESFKKFEKYPSIDTIQADLSNAETVKTLVAGFDLVMDGYLRAIEKQYRFYSYGDAMLIL